MFRQRGNSTNAPEDRSAFRNLTNAFHHWSPFGRERSSSVGQKLISNEASRKTGVFCKPRKQFVYTDGLRLPKPNLGEEDFMDDYLTYMLNFQMLPLPDFCVIDANVRRRIVDYTFAVFTHRTRPLETFFLAIHILDSSIQAHLILSRIEQEVAPAVIAAVDIASKCETLHSVARYFVKDYDMKKIREWEILHLKTFGFETGRCHILHFLRILQPMTLDFTSTAHVGVVWTIIKGLACMSMCEWTIARETPSVAAAAVVRVAIELARMLKLFVRELKDVYLTCLQHEVTEYGPVAIRLVDSLLERRSLSNEQMYPVLVASVPQIGDRAALKYVREAIDRQLTSSPGMEVDFSFVS